MKICIAYLILTTTLLSCGNNKLKKGDPIKTGKPIEAYYGNDSLEMKAIQRIKEYLVENEPQVTLAEFYVDTIQGKQDTIVVFVRHYDYYVERDRADKGLARIKRLEEQGATEIDSIYVPPTGNWSGMDRTMLYLVKKDSLIDILYQ